MRLANQYDTTHTDFTQYTYSFWDTIHKKDRHLMVIFILTDNFVLQEMIATISEVEIPIITSQILMIWIKFLYNPEF